MADMAQTDHRLAEPQWSQGVLVVIGLLSVAAGVIVVAKPSISLATLAVVMGVLLLLDGVLELLHELTDALETSTLGVVVGVVSIVAGVVLARHPFRVVAAAALLLGLWLIVSGAIGLAGAIRDPSRRGWRAAVALVEAIAGIVIVASPHIGVRTLALLVGISFIVRGLLLVAVAWLMGRVATPPLASRGPMAAT